VFECDQGNLNVNINVSVNATCFDDDGDGFNSSDFGSDADCGAIRDCDDNNASVLPPFNGMTINSDTWLCSGTYNINQTSLGDMIITFAASGVTLQGNNTKIIGNTTTQGWAIVTNNFDNNVIRGINVSNYNYGVLMQSGTTGTTVYNMTIDTTQFGVILDGADDNKVFNSSIDNSQIGAYVYSSATGNNFTNMTITEGQTGFYFGSVGTTNNIFQTSNITSASSYGVRIDAADGNILDQIGINGGNYDSNDCIYIQNSADNNNITNSTMMECQDGLEVDSSTGNLFYYNNFIKNSVLQADVDTTGNFFNTTNGTACSGCARGNFWDDIGINGLDITDLNADGFGDSGSAWPYRSSNGGDVSTNVIDYGPIVQAVPITSDNYTKTIRDWNIDFTDINLSVIDLDYDYTDYCHYNTTDPACSSYERSHTEPFTVTLDCEFNQICQFYLRYFSVDQALNVETPKTSAQINIVNNSYIENTSITNSTVWNQSYIIDSDINDSHIDGCYIINSTILASNLTKITECRVINSFINDSNFTDSTVEYSSCNDCEGVGTTIINTTKNDSICGYTGFYYATIVNQILTAGKMTYLGIDYYLENSIDRICQGLPAISITSPAGGAVLNGTITIIFTTPENNTPQISYDGGTWLGTDTFVSHSWDTTIVADGVHTVQIRDEDQTGKYIYTNVMTYTVDNYQEGITILRPSENSVVKNQTLVEALTADYISKVYFSLVNSSGSYDLTGGAGETEDSDSTNGWRAYIDTTNFGEGSYNLTAKAYQRCYLMSNCLNATTTITNITIDKSNPTGTLTIIGSEGTPGSTSYPNVVLNLTWSDVGGLDKCRYANENAGDLINKPWEECSQSKAWVLQGEYGTKTVYAELLDNAGNNVTISDTIEYQYTADTTPPSAPTVNDGNRDDQII